MPLDLGFGSSSQSSNVNPDFIFGPQADALQRLFRRGDTAFGDARTMQNQFFNRQFPGFFDAAQGAVGGQANALTGQGFQAGTGFLQDRLQGGGEALEGAIQGLGGDIGDFFNQQILPGISSSFAGSGGQNVRQGLAQGFAGQSALQQFQRGASNLRFQDLQGQQQAAQGLIGAQLGQAQGFENLLGSLGGLVNFGLAPSQAQFDPASRLAQIIGPPAILGGRRQGSGSSLSLTGGGI